MKHIFIVILVLKTKKPLINKGFNYLTAAYETNVLFVQAILKGFTSLK